MSHYTEEELADYAFNRQAHAEKTNVEVHLAFCADCRKILEFIELLEAALRKPLPWEISDDIRSGTPPPPDALLNRVRTIDEERTSAIALVMPLLESPLRFLSAHVEDDARFQTTGAVAALYRAARDLTERQPQFALSVADAAVSVATKLAASRTLRSGLHLARAHLERGRVLFVIGRYKDAERSLDRAESTYDQASETTGWDLASVWLIRANVYVESERMTEGRALAMAAARQFRIFGDTAMYLNARLLLANALFMEGDFRASAEAAEEIIRLTRERGDHTLLGRALQNCGEAYLLLGDYAKALPLYLEAYAIWDEVGLEPERIRTEWSLATLHIEVGNLEDGIRRLDETYRAFEGLGIINDAALARMQLAEALLRSGRAEGVPDLLRGVVVSFPAEGMMRNARIALAHLHSAIAQNRLSPELVRHVRTYLEQLPLQPTAAFAPLQ